MSYWLPQVPNIVWSIILLIIILGLNLFSVKGYGKYVNPKATIAYSKLIIVYIQVKLNTGLL